MKASSLPALLGELALANPKLVFMRGWDYYRIEDLIRWAKYDMKVGPSEAKELLSEQIYFHTVDGRGKIIVKGTDSRGSEFVAYVEPGSDIRTDVS